ncbi:hypothetical protein [Thorsellia kenyensis]|uniref:Uncharacterized protein n=1 Tax=Thorsellia kenyensis TaxID=1549888 RepID=A0ABV6C7I7_9GAMM
MDRAKNTLTGQALFDWFEELEHDIDEYYESTEAISNEDNLTDIEIQNKVIQKRLELLGNQTLAPDNLFLLNKVFTIKTNLMQLDECAFVLDHFLIDMNHQNTLSENNRVFLDFFVNIHRIELANLTKNKICLHVLTIKIVNTFYQLEKALFLKENLAFVESDYYIDNVAFIHERLNYLKQLLSKHAPSSIAADYMFHHKRLLFKNEFLSLSNTNLPLPKKLPQLFREVLSLYYHRLCVYLAEDDKLMLTVYLDKVNFLINAFGKKYNYDIFLLKIDVLLLYCTHLDLAEKNKEPTEKKWLEWISNKYHFTPLSGNPPILLFLYESWFKTQKDVEESIDTYKHITKLNVVLKVKRIKLFILYEQKKYQELRSAIKENLYDLDDATDALCLDCNLKVNLTPINDRKDKQLDESAAFFKTLIDSIRYLTDQQKYSYVWMKYVGTDSIELGELRSLIIKLFNLLYSHTSYWDKGIMVTPDKTQIDHLLSKAKALEELNPWVIEAELTHCIYKQNTVRMIEIVELLENKDIELGSNFFITYFCQYLFKKIKHYPSHSHDCLRFVYPTEARTLSLFADRIIDVFDEYAMSIQRNAKLDKKSIIIMFYESLLQSYDVFISRSYGQVMDADLSTFENAINYHKNLLCP